MLKVIGALAVVVEKQNIESFFGSLAEDVSIKQAIN
jgi:hypothetical protein